MLLPGSEPYRICISPSNENTGLIKKEVDDIKTLDSDSRHSELAELRNRGLKNPEPHLAGGRRKSNPMIGSKTFDQIRYRTQYIDPPEKRECNDRRRVSCFIMKDRRSGIACRRREQQREMERRIAMRKGRFFPAYYRFV